jgi:hypothetical protein
MLYPLSYEGGGVFVQVRPYFSGYQRSCPSLPCPRRCPLDARATVLAPRLPEQVGRVSAGHDAVRFHPQGRASLHRPRPMREHRFGKPMLYPLSYEGLKL